jgi:hypothetical protein
MILEKAFAINGCPETLSRNAIPHPRFRVLVSDDSLSMRSVDSWIKTNLDVLDR